MNQDLQRRPVDIPSFYNYLTKARRDLWAVLGAAPDEVLAKDVIPGKRFRSIKDLLVHIPVVEDSWLHYDILATRPHLETVPIIPKTKDGPYAAMPLPDILEYWRAVEANTQSYLSKLTPLELARPVQDDGKTVSVEEILWHVLQHEVRHTAQIALLLRQAGLTPPQLDLVFYLPLTKQNVN